jgi:16S rRNA (adenine1518-N6/adenine1519-N6)-dimethyltransferase
MDLSTLHGSDDDTQQGSFAARVRALMRRHGVHPRRRFGQNFLIDEKVLDSILEAAGLTQDDTVIEIGPGLGVLTHELAKRAGRVVAVEIDRELFELLEAETRHLGNVELVNEDILEVSMRALVQRQGVSAGKAKVVANLPYNITTPILVKLIENRALLARAVVMVQLEVAQRIAAGPGSRAYGSLSVFMQCYADISLVRPVPPESFIPAPKVHSAVLCIDFLDEPRLDVDAGALADVVGSAFGMRRKILKNALKNLPGLDGGELDLLFSRSGVDPLRRAETLSLDEFEALAREYAHLRR